MTSDERVQIYVPSPLETTPYNTITRHVEQVKLKLICGFYCSYWKKIIG
jgi:hypothetical protein